MILQQLKIINYRNYSEAEIFPSERLNLFVGGNAQGKTNLLESIYFASLGKSPRTPRDKELIKWGETQATIKAKVLKKCGADELLVKIDTAKRIAINGLSILRMRELMGVIMTVFFSPDELKIVKDGPSERRRFIDIALCQLSKAYFDTLARYNKTLAQRNKLLKNNPKDESIDLWDGQLSTEGARVVHSRRELVSQLDIYAGQVHYDITDNEKLCLSYEGIEGESYEEIKYNMDIALKANRQRDKQYCATSVGPHRDDILISANGTDLRAYGSQGQQRSAALSLKLAEMELLKELSGEYPILLLDDVLSELDEKRQTKLLSKIKSYQTIITGAYISNDVKKMIGSAKEYAVDNGKVVVR